VEVTGVVRAAPTPASAALLAEHRSPELRKIVPLLNKPSDNLIGEMLLKELAWVESKGTTPGSSAGGAAVLLSWLRSKGVETTGVRGGDGSGLSRKNLVTARAMTTMLMNVETEPWWETYRASLPIAGEDGTLRRRMRGTSAAGKLHAKTGSLNGVSALSGYVETASGERLIFSMLTNNFPGEAPGISPPKEVEDSVGVALAEYRRGAVE
jgi:D-alanyl-D-alanine carboxypeptidase/D-alanyl-D-alanine-endopeptidase (penicillin-binding protein 4)